MIGRFSALACADVVHITSYYNGIAYYYVMMKNSGKINIDKISEVSTEEHNGVEVKIAVEYIHCYLNSLSCLWFMKNVYVHSNFEDERITNFNNRQVYYFDTFATGFKDTEYNAFNILLGKVKYPCVFKSIGYDNNIVPNGLDFKDSIKAVTLTFNIGELDVTPNREQLLYSQKTIQAIHNKIKAYREELIKISNSNVVNYDNLKDIYILTQKGNHIKVGNAIIPIGGTGIASNIQYNGKKLSQIMLEVIWEFFNRKLADFTWLINRVENGTIINKTANQRRWNAPKVINLFYDRDSSEQNNKFIIVPSDKGMKGNIFKEYVANKYKNEKVVFLVKPTISKSSIKSRLFLGNLVIKDDATNTKVDTKATLWLWKELMRSFTPYEEIDIINSKEFQDFKKNVSKVKKTNPSTKLSNNIRFRFAMVGDRYFSNKVDCNNFVKADEEIRDWVKYWIDNEKYNIVYGIENSPEISLFQKLYRASTNKWCIVTVAKTNEKCLVNAPSSWINVTDILSYKSRSFIDLLTQVQYGINDTSILGDGDSYLVVSSLLPFLPTNKKESFERVIYNYRKNSYTFTDAEKEILNTLAKEFKKNNILYNEEIIKDFNDYKEFCAKIKPFIGLHKLCRNATSLFAFLLMKKGIMRLNSEKYLEIKNCLNQKQDEDN